MENGKEMRGLFEQRFQDPRSIQPERFLWDYWYVPDQYCLIRTQAQVCYGYHDKVVSNFSLACRSMSVCHALSWGKG